MNRQETQIGGWSAPCEPFDYRQLEETARRECQRVHERLELLKREKPRDAERELLRRREVRLLTDMYYEQRSNVALFREKAERREAAALKKAGETCRAVRSGQ